MTGLTSAALRFAVHSADLELGDFRTERGGVIPNARLHYRILGDPALGRVRGWSLVFHALTGSASVDDWWA
ncbi:MAG TPA: hypothetical protein VLD58_06375, partial [Gemmatimonadales bacterium]|nr:hypothetical protein [Gemmatimonadales bacterium]